MKDVFGIRNTKQDFGPGDFNLPTGKYMIARTFDGDADDWRNPSVKEGNGEIFLFKTMLTVVGGDGKIITNRYAGRTIEYSQYLRPYRAPELRDTPRTQEELNIFDGRMTAFMCAALAPGVEDDGQAWDIVQTKLEDFVSNPANGNGLLTADLFDLPNGTRDNAGFLVSVFAQYLRANPVTMLVSNRLEARRNDPEKKDNKVAGFRSGTIENAAKEGLSMFEGQPGELVSNEVSAEDF